MVENKTLASGFSWVADYSDRNERRHVRSACYTGCGSHSVNVTQRAHSPSNSRYPYRFRLCYGVKLCVGADYFQVI